MTIFSQSFFTLMRRNFMTLTLFTTRHTLVLFISFKNKFPIDQPHHIFQMRDLTQRLDTLINLLDHIRITDQLPGSLIPFDGGGLIALLLMDFGK